MKVTDEDGVDGPFERAMKSAMRDDARSQSHRTGQGFSDRRCEQLLAINGLAALVRHQSVMLEADIRHYGEPRWNPDTPEVRALENRLAEIGAYAPRGEGDEGRKP